MYLEANLRGVASSFCPLVLPAVSSWWIWKVGPGAAGCIAEAVADLLPMAEPVHLPADFSFSRFWPWANGRFSDPPAPAEAPAPALEMEGRRDASERWEAESFSSYQWSTQFVRKRK